jgi:class 3 adenylate cyclase
MLDDCADTSTPRKSKNGAGEGQKVEKDVTFVVTDVEGSTGLWEWDAEVMDISLQLHDAILRALLFRHLGHEVTTEGDSFTVVFHEAVDAVHWCLRFQQVKAQSSAICLTFHQYKFKCNGRRLDTLLLTSLISCNSAWC